MEHKWYLRENFTKITVIVVYSIVITNIVTYCNGKQPEVAPYNFTPLTQIFR